MTIHISTAVAALAIAVISFIYLRSLLLLPTKRNPRNLPLPPQPSTSLLKSLTSSNPSFANKPWLLYHHLHQHQTSPYNRQDVIRLPNLTPKGGGLSPFFPSNDYPPQTIILGSSHAAYDLLEKRSRIYSSRPRFVVGGELLSGGMRGLMAPYGDFWRRWRRLIHGGFSVAKGNVEKFKELQGEESVVLVRGFLLLTVNDDDGDVGRGGGGKEWRKGVERYAASLIGRVTYGRDRIGDGAGELEGDEVNRRNGEAMGRLVGVNIPGKYAAERYPILKYMPGFLAPWKAEVLRQRQKDIELYTELMGEVRERVARGEDQISCFATYLLREQKALGMTDLEIAYTAGSPFGAGVETSAGSVASFFLACVKFGPQFIPQAQAELDAVVGSDRLPTFQDLEKMPYVKAVASETLRWRPVAVLGGTPHASTEDDEYRGMFIPKGSTIIAPLWSIHLNEDDFPDPHNFKPERFTQEREYPGPLGHSAFGWGRRICPGMHLGFNSVHLIIARVLWGFDVGPSLDKGGNPIDVDIFAYSDGFNSSPMPFPCSIKPRSTNYAEVIEKEYQRLPK